MLDLFVKIKRHILGYLAIAGDGTCYLASSSFEAATQLEGLSTLIAKRRRLLGLSWIALPCSV